MIWGHLGRGLGRSWASFFRPWGSYWGLLAALAGWIRHPDVLAGLAGWLGWLAEAPRIQGTPSGEGKWDRSGALSTIRQLAADCKLQSDS